MDQELRDKLLLEVPPIEERSKRERELRRERGESLLKFHVRYLDLALEGIAKKDLILIGAPTGAGKTELVTHIGGYNAFKGHRVLFFPLEAEDCEIESRIKFKIAVQKYFEDKNPQKTIIRDISYRNWYHNKLGESFQQYEEQAEEKFTQAFSKFNTVYRKNEFKIDHLQRYLLSLKDKTDLVIIDHLNYFDFDNENENKAVTDIVKRIRDLALLSGLPIILVAHLKKVDRRSKSLIPEIDDFFGTSNIPKIATKAILLSPDNGTPDDPKRFGTFFRVAKYRVDGSTTRYVSKCTFNIESNKYEDQFLLGYLTDDGRRFEPISDRTKFPTWALGGGLA